MAAQVAGFGGQFGAVGQTDGVVRALEHEHRRQSSSGLTDLNNEEKGFESSNETPSERDEKVTSLARTFTQHSIRQADGQYINPFLGSDDPLLDPNSGKFSARAWTKTLVGIQSRDPERYPKRVAGISYTGLNVHGYGSPTDYQKSFGNMPLGLASSLVSKLTGRGKTKIQILRDFDGLVKSGEMLVVLGRPGR